MSDAKKSKSRGELLADLAEAVNELTEPRHHTEYLIKEVVESVDANGGRRRKAKRTRRREKHVVTLPGLLESLARALVPGADNEMAGGSGAGGFESRPSIELEPVAVMREIRRDATMYASALRIDKRATLGATLHGLVGAQHTDEQLRNLARDAQRWVKRARLATGFDAAPLTIGERCPNCWRRNGLIITSDLDAAHCKWCGTEWDHDTIGQLAEMLRVNATQTTVVAARCHWDWCQLVGPHAEHLDPQGRTVRDSCDVAGPSWRLTPPTWAKSS